MYSCHFGPTHPFQLPLIMLDHFLGRPSPGFKRIQVGVTVFLVLSYMRVSSWNQNALFLFINKLFRNWPPWKVVLATFTLAYLTRNLPLMLFLNAPEPFDKMYTRNFFRATWLLTAMDAGFFTVNLKSNCRQWTLKTNFFEISCRLFLRAHICSSQMPLTKKFDGTDLTHPLIQSEYHGNFFE